MKDRYLEAVSATGREETDLILLSLLPGLGMLNKLLTRKERGKRPFSPSFGFSARIQEIQELTQLLLSERGREGKELLERLAETCDRAVEEIRTPSLQEDIRWLGEGFENAILAIEEERRTR